MNHKYDKTLEYLCFIDSKINCKNNIIVTFVPNYIDKSIKQENKIKRKQKPELSTNKTNSNNQLIFPKNTGELPCFRYSFSFFLKIQGFDLFRIWPVALQCFLKTMVGALACFLELPLVECRTG